MSTEELDVKESALWRPELSRHSIDGPTQWVFISGGIDFCKKQSFKGVISCVAGEAFNMLAGCVYLGERTNAE